MDWIVIRRILIIVAWHLFVASCALSELLVTGSLLLLAGDAFTFSF